MEKINQTPYATSLRVRLDQTHCSRLNGFGIPFGGVLSPLLCQTRNVEMIEPCYVSQTSIAESENLFEVSFSKRDSTFGKNFFGKPKRKFTWLWRWRIPDFLDFLLFRTLTLGNWVIFYIGCDALQIFDRHFGNICESTTIPKEARAFTNFLFFPWPRKFFFFQAKTFSR